MPIRFATCNLCDSMCGIRVELDPTGPAGAKPGRPGPARIRSVRGDPDDVLSRGHVCPKVAGLAELLDDPDRIRAPRIRLPGGRPGELPRWREASWDEALNAAVGPLRAIRRAHGPHAVGLYVGTPVVHAHRSAIAAQLLTMALGSHNRYDPNSQDSNPRLYACMQVYGDGLTMPIPDIERVDYLLMLGANPAASNGGQMSLGDARGRFAAVKARGGRIVVIDPRRSESVAWATRHHPIRPGGDAALVLAMLNVLFARGGLPPVRASGRAELVALAAEFPPEAVADAIGMSPETIRTLAHEFADSPRACAYSRVGISQSAFGPTAAWLIECLNIVTGNLDRAGGSIFPTPAADIGPLARLVIGNRAGQFRSRVRGLPELFGALPSTAMAEEMETPGPGQLRAMVVLAGNPVSSTPNSGRLDKAFAGLEHVVSIDYYVNETSRHASVILPARHVLETDMYDLILSRFQVHNAARYSPAVLTTADDTRDDWEIATELAIRLRLPRWLHGVARRALRDAPELALDLLLRTGPFGRSHRLSLRTLREHPHGVDLGPLEPGRVRIPRPGGLPDLAPAPLVADLARVRAWIAAEQGPEGTRGARPLVLIGRRHVRSNNSWMHNLRALTRGTDRSHLLMHPADAGRAGIADGDEARVTSRVGEVVVRVRVSDEVMEGVVSLPHGFGQAALGDALGVASRLPGVNANLLTDDQLVEPVVGTSILNGLPVTVQPSTAPVTAPERGAPVDPPPRP